MKQHVMLGVACGILAGLICAPSATTADTLSYTQDFESIKTGELPEGFLVLGGDFAVRQVANNKFLELPGAPLESFGAVFGPATNENLTVSARIHSTNRKRRYPAFGVGLNGVGGYRLILSPAKRRLELYKGDNVITAVSYKWTPDTWTWFRLQLRRTGDQEWSVQGKVWKAGDPEPAGWIMTHSLEKKPYSGKASIWATPYAGTPIRFDDIKVGPTP